MTVQINTYDVDALNVCDSDANTHPGTNIELIDINHIPMATEVECTFSIQSSEERRQLGKSSKLMDHGAQLEGLVDSDDKPPSMSVKRRKRVEKLLERTIYISAESYLEYVQVGYLFLNKKYVAKKLYLSISCP